VRGHVGALPSDGLGCYKAAHTRTRKEDVMAADTDFEKEMTVHRRGYERFIGLFRMSAVICAIIAFVVILLIRK
jgi:hypothetical protein